MGSLKYQNNPNLGMPELSVTCGKIEKQISDIREKATARQWANLSRPAFVNMLAGVIPGLEELHSLFQMGRTEIDRSGQAQKPDIAEHCREINQLITVLKRNAQMETERLDSEKAQGINAMAESVTTPALYSDLEQKVLSMLLRSTYAIERIAVFGRKRDPTGNTRGAQRNILELLEKKETELEDLRVKYEETRKQSFLGLAEKDSSVEIENSLNEVSRKLEAKTALLRKQFDGTKDSILQSEAKLAELEERMLGVEELESQVLGKTFELMTMLKKERDYAKRMLIEIEHETIQLRNTYSKELLGLQEEKLTLRNSLEDRFSREISELRRELAARNRTITHLQEMVSSREKKMAKLEAEEDRLRLINKALHKHATVRAKFKTKAKKAK